MSHVTPANKGGKQTQAGEKHACRVGRVGNKRSGSTLDLSLELVPGARVSRKPCDRSFPRVASQHPVMDPVARDSTAGTKVQQCSALWSAAYATVGSSVQAP